MSTKLFPLWIAFNITLLFLGLIFLFYFLIQLRKKILLKEKLLFLKPSSTKNSFAFALLFEQEAFFHGVKLSILSHKDQELFYTFPVKDESFCLEIPFQQDELNFLEFLKNNPNEIVLVQFHSTGPHFFQFEWKALEFLTKLSSGKITCEDYEKKFLSSDAPTYTVPKTKFINDTPINQRSFLVVESHPKLKNLFQPKSASTSEEEKKVETFKVQKVWIEPGCIVCNACENIYPEVFDVKAPTCIIKDNAPLDDGVKIQEAAEACPVNVIKFIK